MTVVQRERQHGCSHFETVQRAELIGSELLRGHSSHHNDTLLLHAEWSKLTSHTSHLEHTDPLLLHITCLLCTFC